MFDSSAPAGLFQCRGGLQSRTMYSPALQTQNSSFSPYNMNIAGTESTRTTLQMERFANLVCEGGIYRFHNTLLSFATYQKQNSESIQFSREENILDLVMMGVLWNTYKHYSGNMSIGFKKPVFMILFKLRSKSAGHKKLLDALRGWLGKKWLLSNAKQHNEISFRKLKRLNLWLESCCEFQGETARISCWIQFLCTRDKKVIKELLLEISWFGEWFQNEAKKAFGIYTQNVLPFIKQKHASYLGREDYFFTGRSEAEYHLNLLAAEIMNRNMRQQFLKTKKKILLLPSCMAQCKECKAQVLAVGKVCSHCTPNCHISKSTLSMHEIGIETRIVDHATGFRASLKQWAHQQETGLIGTACLLNLITGGMEMKKLNIPAQCVFLDYSGCQKHWNSMGVPTNINLEQVKAHYCQTQAV